MWEDVMDKIEPCKNSISRQAAIDAFERFIHELGIEDEPYNYGEMALSVKNVPPVTPKPKTGYWIDKDEKSAVCSCCNRNNILYGDFCKWCGAKMSEIPTGSEPQERSDKECCTKK